MSSTSLQNDSAAMRAPLEHQDGLFSLEQLISDLSQSNDIIDENKDLLRRFLRKGEIFGILYSGYTQPGFKAIKEHGVLKPEYVDAFLELVLEYYALTKDLKVLNGFLKLATSPMGHDAPRNLLERSERYLEEITI